MILSGCFLHLMLVVTSCTEFHDKVFRELLRLCPGQYVPTDNGTELNQTSEFDSCCTDPFSNSSLQSPVLNKTNYATYGQRCLFPNTDDRLKQVQNERSYLMITDPPKDGCLLPDIDTVNTNGNLVLQPTCNDSDVMPLKRFLPVYSESVGFIYKNPHCASCHGQNDVKLWEMFAFCESSGAPSFDIEACNLQFVYPGDYADIQHLECFTEYFSSCPSPTTAENVIIFGTDLSKNELSDACAMDNLPKFEHVSIAKNIFCYMCHHYCQRSCKGFPFTTCERPRTFTGSKGTMGGFTRVIDSRVVSHVSSAGDTVCGLDQDEQICHDVLCPLGQLWTFDGSEKKCQIVSTQWTTPMLVIFLLLEFDQDIGVSKTNLDTILRRVKTPWPKVWSMEKLYQPIARNVDMVFRGYKAYNVTKALPVDPVNHAFVKLIYSHNNVRSVALLRDLEKLLNMTSWHLAIEGKRYRARQTVSSSMFWNLRFWGLFTRKESSYLHMLTWQLSNDVEPHRRWLYRTFDSTAARKHEYSLNKLLVCKQVELASTNFHVEIQYGFPVALYYNRTGQHLFDNEFTTGSSKDGKQTFRLCISDTRLKANENARLQFSLTLLLFATVISSII